MMTLHASKHRIKNDKYQLLKVIAINSVIRLQPKKWIIKYHDMDKLLIVFKALRVFFINIKTSYGIIEHYEISI